MIAGIDAEYGRRTGKSTTWALQKLKKSVPIDMTPETMRKMTSRQRCNYKLLAEIAEKLEVAGVPHAKICRTREEMEKAMKYIFACGRMSGKFSNNMIFDEIKQLPDDV